jgi:hypothetical protein
MKFNIIRFVFLIIKGKKLSVLIALESNFNKKNELIFKTALNLV